MRSLWPLAFALCACVHHVPDASYQPVVSEPAYPDRAGRAPIVAIDETHGNRHTKAGSYEGFGRLLAADGYRVEAFDDPFVAADCSVADLSHCSFDQALRGIDTLVIADASARMSAREAELVAAWVQTGGSLLLVASQSPFSGAVSELTTRLGIDWRDTEPIPFDFFRAADGTLNDRHPVTLGRSSREEIPEVRSFHGSALTRAQDSPVSTAAILTFPAGLGYRGPEGVTHSLDGLAQGLVVYFGFGRVYASGDATMLTAEREQTIQFVPEPKMCDDADADQRDECLAEVERLQKDPPPPPRPIGMQVTPHNEQFLLNVMHFLSGLL